MLFTLKLKLLCRNLHSRYTGGEWVGLLLTYLFCLAAFCVGLSEFVSPKILGSLLSLVLVVTSGLLLLFVPFALIIVNWPDKADLERPPL